MFRSAGDLVARAFPLQWIAIDSDAVGQTIVFCRLSSGCHRARGLSHLRISEPQPSVP